MMSFKETNWRGQTVELQCTEHDGKIVISGTAYDGTSHDNLVEGIRSMEEAEIFCECLLYNSIDAIAMNLNRPIFSVTRESEDSGLLKFWRSDGLHGNLNVTECEIHKDRLFDDEIQRNLELIMKVFHELSIGEESIAHVGDICPTT